MFLNISEKRPNATKKASTKPSKKQKSIKAIQPRELVQML